MRKILLFAAIAASLSITSCQKETAQLPDNALSEVTSNAGLKKSKAVHFKTRQVFEEPGTFWNDCTQELMNYTGNVHIVIQGTINDNKVSTVEHVNYMNLSAIGETSHVTYRGSVIQNNSSNTSNANGSYTYTGQLSLKFVSPGGKNNFVQKIFYHITINAKGETTSEIDKANYGSCQ